MNKKMPLLIASAIAAVGLVGGVVTAFAVNTSAASQTVTYTVDDAIYLHWGSNVLGDVTDLSTPVVKTVIVAAPTGNETTGNVKLSLALEKKPGENNSIAGVQVEISKTEFGQETVADYTLKTGTLTKDYDHTVAALKTANAPYYLRISFNEEEFNEAKADNENLVVSGTLTATLSYIAA